MLKTYLRPMTEAERDKLSTALLRNTNTPLSLADPILWGIGYAFLSLIPAVLILIVLATGNYFDPWAAIVVLSLALLGFIVGFQKNVRAEIRRRKEHAAILAQRLMRGEVEITEVTATDVVEVGEDNWLYLFDIGNREVLGLSGSYFWNDEDNTEEEEIPSQFEILRYPDAPDEIAHVKSKGHLLPISRTLYWNEDASIGELEKGEVLKDVTLATIEQDRPDLFAAE